MFYRVAKRVQQRKTCFIKHCDKDSGTEFAQIMIRLSLVRVRESNNVLQAAPMVVTRWDPNKSGYRVRTETEWLVLGLG